MEKRKEIKIGLEMYISFTWPKPAAKVWFFKGVTEDESSDVVDAEQEVDVAEQVVA